MKGEGCFFSSSYCVLLEFTLTGVSKIRMLKNSEASKSHMIFIDIKAGCSQCPSVAMLVEIINIKSRDIDKR